MSACAVGRAVEGTGLLLVQLGLVAGWVAPSLRSTTAFVAMCLAGFWDAGEGAAGTVHACALEGALKEYKGIIDRTRLAL